MSTKGHIGTIIAARENELYGDLQKKLHELEDYLANVIMEIGRNMVYDYRDCYLVVVFQVDFKKSPKGALTHAYITMKELNPTGVEMTKCNSLQDLPEFLVERDTLEYFVSRILTNERIKSDFAGKKMAAYQIEWSQTTTNSGHMQSFMLHLTYILGAQKNKPIV